MGTPPETDLRQTDLIDTNVLIDSLNEYPPGRAVREGYRWVRVSVSVVSVAEIWAGTRDDHAESVLNFLTGFDVYPADVPIAQEAGRYLREFGRSHGVELPDALIAATAKVHNLRLVTRDRKHFPMRDIKIWVPY